jgi:hypothetical protein
MASRTYSVFEQDLDTGFWVRKTNGAYVLPVARTLFQDYLLRRAMVGRKVELRPAAPIPYSEWSKDNV